MSESLVRKYLKKRGHYLDDEAPKASSSEIFVAGNLTKGTKSIVRAIDLRKIYPDRRHQTLEFIKYWEKTRHPGIVSIRDIEVIDSVVLFFEDSLDLLTLVEMKHKADTFTSVQVAEALYTISDGLEILSKSGFNLKELSEGSIGFAMESSFSPRLLPRGEILGCDAELENLSRIRFLAPEIIGGMKATSNQSLVLYSLGVFVYELCSRLTIFEGDNLKAIASQIYSVTPPLLSSLTDRIEKPLCDIIHRLIRKGGPERYNSFEGFKFDLGLLIENFKDKNTKSFALGRQDSKRELNYKIPMVGRKTEIKLLGEAWIRTLKGNGCIQVIGALSGTGKTRLANEIITVAESDDAMILKMKFSTYETNVPLSAINRCLAAYTQTMQNLDSESLKSWQNKISTALGDGLYLLRTRLEYLKNILPPASKLKGVDKDREEQLFFDSFARFLTLLSPSDSSVLIFVDDLQWADHVSINLMQFVVKLSNNKKMRKTHVVGAFRTEEVETEDDIQEKVLNLIPGRDTIFLDSLTREESYELVASLIDESGPEVKKIQEFTYSLTEGRPFFIYEFLENSINVHYQRDDDGHWKFNESSASFDNQSEDLDEMARNRILRLSEDTKRSIFAASVVGAAIEKPTLLHLLTTMETIESFESKEDIPHILDRSIHELQLEHMIQDSHDPIVFFHDRVRQAAWTLIDDDLKVHLHREFSTYHYKKLAELNDDIEASFIFEIAFHTIEGGLEGNLKQGVRILYIAAKKAMSLFSFRKAKDYLKAVSDYLPLSIDQEVCDDFDLTPAEILDIYEIYADALSLAEEIHPAIKLYNELLKFTDEKLSRAKIYKKISLNNLYIFDYVSAVNASREGLQLLNFKLCVSESLAIAQFPLALFRLLATAFVSLFYSNGRTEAKTEEQRVVLEVALETLVPSYFTKPICVIVNIFNLAPLIMLYKPNPKKALYFSYMGAVFAALGLFYFSRKCYDIAEEYFANDPQLVDEVMVSFTRSYLLEFPKLNMKAARLLNEKSIGIAKSIGETFWRVLNYLALIHFNYAEGKFSNDSTVESLVNDYKRVRFGATVMQCTFKHLLIHQKNDELKYWFEECRESYEKQRQEGFLTLDGVYYNISAGEIFLLQDKLDEAIQHLKFATKTICFHLHRVVYTAYATSLLTMAYCRNNQPIRAILPMIISWLNIFTNIKVYKGQTLFATGEVIKGLGLTGIGLRLMERGVKFTKKHKLSMYENELRVQLGSYYRDTDVELALMHLERANYFFKMKEAHFYVERTEELIAGIDYRNEEKTENTRHLVAKDRLNMQAIIDVFLGLSSAENVDCLAIAALDAIKTCTGADQGMFFRLENSQLIPIKSFGLPTSLECLIDKDTAAFTVQARRYWDFTRMYHQLDTEQQRPSHLDSYGDAVSALLVPLYFKQRQWGAIAVGHREIKDLFAEQSLEIVNTLAIQIAIGMYNFDLLSEVTDLNEQLKEHVRNVEAEVRSKTRDVQSIFSSIELAVLAIEEDGIIHPHFSPYTNKLFPKISSSDNIKDVILSEQSSELVTYVESVLMSSLGENILCFDVNNHVLPHLIETQNGSETQKIELIWNPILADDEATVEKILLVAKDVTEIEKLKIESKEQQMFVTILAEIIQCSSTALKRFKKSSSAMIQDLLQGIDAREIDHAKALAVIHTLKGNARTLGLKTLASLVHSTEQDLIDCKELDSGLQRIHVQSLLELYDRYRSIMAQHLPETLDAIDGDSLRSEDVERLLEGFDVNLLDETNLRAFSSLQDLTQQYIPNSLRQIVKNLHPLISETAKILEKQIPKIKVSGDLIVFNDEESCLLADALTHLLNNSIDHGLEVENVRASKNKDAQGCITIHCEKATSKTIIFYADDGKGVDLELLKSRSSKKGIAGDNFGSKPEILEFIFDSGVSTKDEVTQISGRGVGMNAVRSSLRHSGHNIEARLGKELESGNHQLCFTITINHKGANSDYEASA